MAITSGTVTIGTEPTLICTMGAGGALLFPSGDGVFIGGPDVTASGDKMGVPLPTTGPTCGWRTSTVVM